jgi:thiol peroxidase
MKTTVHHILGIIVLSAFLAACTPKTADIAIDSDSVLPGSTVTRVGKELPLMGTAIKIGQPLPVTSLVDAKTMKEINLADMRGTVLFLSIVPSIDTKVCEAQTHYLGEQGDRLPSDVVRITVSRDTPFAQTRFAEEGKLADIQYLSDYKEGAFGKSVGLLIDDLRLLARSVVLVDKKGIVRYIQVVPEITNLPDMEKAFERAIDLASE